MARRTTFFRICLRVMSSDCAVYLQATGKVKFPFHCNAMSFHANSAEGYDTPRNLQNYAIYLDTRIRTYKELKHDPVRVQSDSNRDERVERELGNSAVKASSGPQRSKTIMGRKLRSMTVEKGLLRETKAVQRAMASLVECQV